MRLSFKKMDKLRSFAYTDYQTEISRCPTPQMMTRLYSKINQLKITMNLVNFGNNIRY